ncbi:glycosyltransferase [Sporosarcina trichiuri]|uniref:glycosyltransferase n=1 Tax=Sporosarcina trichiuri TaxID=3056445 RepID=UPI0025B29D67|nr:TPR domain-containing glycosyltransferase [Sporosarcina sp. 0.2-SM1T-5]WJY26124.1 glycosyltransferase [Sporosarcina sp. 0.2-SM1T-5]
MTPTLSVCMIVRNEEKVIGRCLESIVGIADEIIVVDTGSSDQTKSIASIYTNKIYDFTWSNDFSAARNYAASKAIGNWILALDADEYLDRKSFEKFKTELQINPPIFNIIGLQIVSFIGEKGNNTALNYHERLYRNNSDIFYVRNIHEVLKHRYSQEVSGVKDLQIYHTGYLTEVMQDKNKSSRNLALLLGKKDKEPMDYFFIANEYRNLNKLNQAIRYYRKAYSLKPNIDYDWVKKTLLFLTETLHSCKRDKEALEILESCIEIYPNLVDYKFFKGAILFDLKSYDKSKIVFEEILFQKENLVADSSIDFLELSPLKYLGQIYEIENEVEKAVKSFSRALSLNKSDDQLWIKLISVLASQTTLEELSVFLNNNLLKEKSMTPLKVIKILLAIPNMDVQKLSRSLLTESLTEVQHDALLLKNLLLDNRENEVLNYFVDRDGNKAIEVLATGIFSITDFIILSITNNSLGLREFLYEIKYDQSLNNLYNLIFKGTANKLSLTEENLYIKISEQAKVMNNSKSIELLYCKSYHLSKNGREKVREVLK